MRILIVDDDDACRLLARTTVEESGYEVVEATGGRSAWADFQRGYFPIVISDWIMPDLDGLEFCRRVRSADRTRYSYFILLTAWTGPSNFVEAMEAGVDDFLSKPLDRIQLMARLHVAERILGLQAHLRQLEGLLAICSYCKRIREGESWVPVENYVAARTDASFSHSICPLCMDEHVRPQLKRRDTVR